MTDDFTHKLLFEQWEEDEYSHDEYMMTSRWCTDEDCIFPDPFHSPDECFTVEMAEEYHKEGMRTSDEYKLALSEVLEKVESMKQQCKQAANVQTSAMVALSTLKQWLEGQMK